MMWRCGVLELAAGRGHARIFYHHALLGLSTGVRLSQMIKRTAQPQFWIDRLATSTVLSTEGGR